MSDRASSDRPAEPLWVVDVTAPLPPGRVRLVAAEAAARLDLPAEKLVALLENRIGPVTKPLPKASADRVAEVLDLAGADVAIRTAREGEGATPAKAAPRSAGAAGAASRTEAARPETPGAAAAGSGAVRPGAPHDAANPAPNDTPNASPSETRDAPTPGTTQPEMRNDAESDPVVVRDDADDAEGAAARGEGGTVGRSGRRTAVETPPPAASPPASARAAPDAAQRPRPDGAAGETRDATDPAAEDAWERMADEDDDGDAAMLGAWRQRVPRPPPEPGPDARSTTTAAGSDPAGSAAPTPAASGAAKPATAGDGPARAAWDDEAGIVDPDDEDDAAYAYGFRDPFAEAERRERAMRRWALIGALAIALAVFLGLQWAYSRPGLDERVPPPYEAGLSAYREGAFVSAARAWTPRAEAGDVRAMHMLGWMAQYGQGRPWSNAEAAGWYRQAAERGYAPAQAALAELHARGLGVAQDADQARRWYLAAAEGGVPHAQREAALALAAAGRADEALTWLERAAAHDPEAAAWWTLVRGARR